jgi:hypothetical protein
VARDAIFDFAGNYQGKKNIWFVGGWTNWFDSQEACLDSATMVARRLPSNELPNTGRIVRNDPEMHRRHIRAMVRRMQRAVPADQRKHHEQLEKQLEKLDAD